MMRLKSIIIAATLAFVVLAGCSSSPPPVAAPTPEDSGAEKEGDKKTGKGRIPPPPK